ncbi:MAG: DUF116 domain-containing protein [Candidatus Thorarchaeota archaeon]
MSKHENLSDENVNLDEIVTLDKITQLLEEEVAANKNLSQDDLAKIAVVEFKITDEDLLNYTYIEAGNILNRGAYSHIPMEGRILLIPHCLRDHENCSAPVDDEGYHCQKCGRCVINDITLKAESRGIKWYMVGGGSHAIRIVKNARPRAVLGIACFNDAKIATEKIGEYGIPTQAILLSKDGCVNTEVDFERVSNGLER